MAVEGMIGVNTGTKVSLMLGKAPMPLYMFTSGSIDGNEYNPNSGEVMRATEENIRLMENVMRDPELRRMILRGELLIVPTVINRKYGDVVGIPTNIPALI